MIPLRKALLGVAAISIVLTGCSHKSSVGPSQPPRVRLVSLSPNSGSPGIAVEAFTSGTALQPGTVAARMNGAILPAIVSHSHLTFFVPILPPGRHYVVLIDSVGTLSDSLEFTVSPPPPTNMPPGEVFREVSQATDGAVQDMSLLAGWLKSSGVLTSADSTSISRDMLTLSRLLSNANGEVQTWSAADRTALDAYLMQSGLSDFFGVGGHGTGLAQLSTAIHEASVNRSVSFDKFEALVLADNFSMTLSAIKAGLSISTIAVIFVPGAQAVGFTLGALSVAVGILDGAVDGYLPTDVHSVDVSFVPVRNRSFAVGDSAEVALSGTFQSQSNPASATIKSSVELLFFGVNALIPEDVLNSVREQLTYKIASMAATSTTSSLINSRPVTETGVAMDIAYYSGDFRSLFVSATVAQAMAVLLDKFGVDVPSLGEPPGSIPKLVEV